MSFKRNYNRYKNKKYRELKRLKNKDNDEIVVQRAINLYKKYIDSFNSINKNKETYAMKQKKCKDLIHNEILRLFSLSTRV